MASELALHVSGLMGDGTIRMVVSRHGRVLMEDALRIPSDPAPSDYVGALRFFADRVEECAVDLQKSKET